MVCAMNKVVIATAGLSIHPKIWPTLAAMFLFHLTLET